MMTGPGERNCTCTLDYIGDGIKCKANVMRVRTLELSNFSHTVQNTYRPLHYGQLDFTHSYWPLYYYRYTGNHSITFFVISITSMEREERLIKNSSRYPKDKPRNYYYISALCTYIVSQPINMAKEMYKQDKVITVVCFDV